LASDVLIAKEIIISQQGKPSKFNMGAELDYILKAANEDRIFVVGNRICLSYYGKKLIYKIIEIKTDESDKEQTADENDLLDFNALTIEPANKTFYKAIFATEWTVLNTTDESKDTNKYKIDDIGGYDALISKIKAKVASTLNKYRSNISATRGILLHGLVGVGKATIAKAVIAECNVNMFSVSHSDIDSTLPIDKTRERLQKLFKSATCDTPSVILLQDIDRLCKIQDASGKSYKQVITSLLISLFNDLERSNKDVLVMVTTSELDSVDISLREDGRLNAVFEIDKPSRDGRTEILTKLLSKMPNTLSEENVKYIALNTSGFVGADLRRLCCEANANATERMQEKRIDENQAIMTVVDFDHALSIVKPLAMIELQIKIPNVKMSDIGGQKELKRKLQQTIEWPLKYPEGFVRLGIEPSKGILMYGPPGCSKTMIAKAVATECSVNFINVEVRFVRDMIVFICVITLCIIIIMIQDVTNTVEMGWRIRKGCEQYISKSETSGTVYHLYR